MHNKHFRVNRTLRLFVPLLLGYLIATGGHVAKAQSIRPTEQEVHAVVSNYLTAWQQGDANAMCALWDAKSRQEVTADQLRHILTVDISGNSQDDTERRRLLGGANQVLRGRIASIVSVKVHPETSDYATVDYTVQTTFQSLMGVPYVSLLPELLKQAKAQDDQTTGSESAFAVAVAALAVDKPANVSTLGGNFEVITHGLDIQDTQGPFVTLFLHQYTLVKEQGQWKISNAVSVSSQHPAQPD